MSASKNRCGCTRRAFLRRAAGASGALAAMGGLGPLGRLATAAYHPDTADRYFVFAYFSGGWDILLGLDPRDPAVFTNGNLRATRIQPGYDLAGGSDNWQRLDTSRGAVMELGPFIGDLANHVDKMAIVRGMSMETLTHEVGRRRFLTGMAPSGLQARGSSATTWLASRLGEREPIPNLSLQVETYNRGLPAYASGLRAGNVSDLLRALKPADPQLSVKPKEQLELLLADTAACDYATKSPFWQQAEGARRKAWAMVGGGLDGNFDFTSNRPEIVALRDRYGFTRGQVGSNQQAIRSLVSAALASQALIGGVSRCVSVRITTGLDTHFDNWEDEQGSRQLAGFNGLARLVEHLESEPYGDSGASWMDHTTIVAFSEFSRTAMLNSRGGRDHSLTNACMLMGAGIKGGQTIGRSSDVGMTPVPINLRTGRPDPGGEVPRPEHVLQVLLSEVGIGSEADLRVPPLEALRNRG